MHEWARQVLLPGLVFARCGALFAVVPPLNLRQFPIMLRLGLAAVLATVLAPIAGTSTEVTSPGPGVYTALVVREAAIGAMMGFAAALVFHAFSVAGQLLDTYLGTGDTTTRSRGTGPLTVFTYAFAAAIFMAIDGHHWIVEALAEGLRTVPVGGAITVANLTELLTPARTMLSAGVAIATPTLAAIYAAEVALAAFDRLAPGLGLAGASIPVRWTTAFLGFAVSLPLLATLGCHYAGRSVEAMTAALALVSGH